MSSHTQASDLGSIATQLKDKLLWPSKNHRPEHGEAFTSCPAICGTGKELLSDPDLQYSEKYNPQIGRVQSLQGTRSHVQVIFRPPQFFGHLFLKKGASQYPRRSRNELLGLHVFPNAEPKPFYAELDTITELGLNTRLITTLQRLTGAASRRSARTGQIRRIGCTRG